jgi:hypothetical protein
MQPTDSEKTLKSGLSVGRGSSNLLGEQNLRVPSKTTGGSGRVQEPGSRAFVIAESKQQGPSPGRSKSSLRTRHSALPLASPLPPPRLPRRSSGLSRRSSGETRSWAERRPQAIALPWSLYLRLRRVLAAQGGGGAEVELADPVGIS